MKINAKFLEQPTPYQLTEFYKELSVIIDMCVVNEKQNNAVKYKILQLMNQLWMFEMPEGDDNE